MEASHMDTRDVSGNDGGENRRQNPCLYHECCPGEDRRAARSPEAHCRINLVETSEKQRLRELRELVEDLPDDEVAVYEDEVDIHLNPKIGLDWMVRGQQKEVLTPGQNDKRYLAGALNARTGELIWAESDSKNSLLFIQLLWKLHQRYPNTKKIHVILDNYSIHSTEEVAKTLETKAGQRFALHFLPPYCPDHNKIERAWQDLHANVTRNHNASDMSELMKNVRYYLGKQNRQKSQYSKAA